MTEDHAARVQAIHDATEARFPRFTGYAWTRCAYCHRGDATTSAPESDWTYRQGEMIHCGAHNECRAIAAVRLTLWD